MKIHGIECPTFGGGFSITQHRRKWSDRLWELSRSSERAPTAWSNTSTGVDRRSPAALRRMTGQLLCPDKSTSHERGPQGGGQRRRFCGIARRKRRRLCKGPLFHARRAAIPAAGIASRQIGAAEGSGWRSRFKGPHCAQFWGPISSASDPNQRRGQGGALRHRYSVSAVSAESHPLRHLPRISASFCGS